MEKKIVYKIFTIADYDREAAYFKKMHSQGWKLKKVSYSHFLVAVRYAFEACPPQDVAYQLDFRPIKKAEQDPTINCLRIVAGSILQTLISFLISVSQFLRLMRRAILKSIMMLGLS